MRRYAPGPEGSCRRISSAGDQQSASEPPCVRRKTYLSPEEQWDQSVELVMTRFWKCAARRIPHIYVESRPPPILGYHLWLGRIAAPHRFFLAGDIVLVRISNGEAQRQPVWAVSSKGYTVMDFYLKYQSWWETPEDKDLKKSAGPLRLVELPDDLRERPSDDPAVRQFVAALRAGYADPG
jgi:hypothetical protein